MFVMKLIKKFFTLTLALCLFATLPADSISYADQQIVVWGHGYGHGVGMCQYGAYGLAKTGAKYGSILNFYFKGTTIKQYSASPPTVRVLIRETTGFVEISGSPSVSLYNEAGSAYVLLNSTNMIKIERVLSGGSVLLRVYEKIGGSYRPKGTYTGPLKVTASGFVSYYEPTSEGYKRYDYKGNFRIVANATKQTLNLVNYVDLESYVYGIAEMPSSWPLEALKAQAVAARTYAFQRIKGTGIYDLTDDQSSQVYIGLNKINGSYGQQWKQACDDTARQLLYYGSEPAHVYYHSTCGGHTENSEDVWSSTYPEVRGVPCAYCSSSKYFSWQTTITIDDVRRAFNDSSIIAVLVASRVKDRRVGEVTLYKSDGQLLKVSGSTFRSKLGLKSTWFYLSVKRIAGRDRYETNLIASQKTFSDARWVVVVSGDRNYTDGIDGIGAAPLAGALEAPILLTTRDYLKATAKSELLRLNPEKVYLIGGPGVIAANVENEIKSLLPTSQVVRLSGSDRYETNVRVLNELYSQRELLSKTALVVNGKSIADAVSASPLVYGSKAPLILTNGSSISQDALGAITLLGINRVIIVGDTGVVSEKVEEVLKSKLGTSAVERVGGKDRYETAYKIALRSLNSDFGFNSNSIAVVSGLSFADALSASFYCGACVFPVLLTKPDTGSYWAKQYLNQFRPAEKNIFGGTGAVSLIAEIQLFSY